VQARVSWRWRVTMVVNGNYMSVGRVAHAQEKPYRDNGNETTHSLLRFFNFRWQYRGKEQEIQSYISASIQLAALVVICLLMHMNCHGVIYGRMNYWDFSCPLLILTLKVHREPAPFSSWDIKRHGHRLDLPLH